MFGYTDNILPNISKLVEVPIVYFQAFSVINVKHYYGN